MGDWQLMVRMARSVPFYAAISCLTDLVDQTAILEPAPPSLNFEGVAEGEGSEVMSSKH